MQQQLTIFTKFCLPCVRTEQLKDIRLYCEKHNLQLAICRTTYDTKLHEKASSLWGDENYGMFINLNGSNIDFDEFHRRITKVTKKKPVKNTKAKKKKIANEIGGEE